MPIMPSAADSDLHELAEAVGLARGWRDVDGNERAIADEDLSAILEALGYPSATDRQRKSASAELAARGGRIPPLVVTEVGLQTPLAGFAGKAELIDEHGAALPITIEDGQIPSIAIPGYYTLSLGREALALAVAPRQCPLPGAAGQRMWGTSLQIPALRAERQQAFGNFGELATAVQSLARAGCDAVAINPVHALFPGAGENFSPYSPSSRQFLNTAMGDPALLGLPPLPESAGGPLIDWPAALPERLSGLRRTFALLGAEQRARIAEANQAEGPALLRHGLFDALDCHFRPLGARGWQDWPQAYRDPSSHQVAAFARENQAEIEFHLFTQWLAREGLAKVQRQARHSGMAIGLLADLAVGVVPGGSDSWAMPGAMLNGLTIGAPPDPLGPLGQNWSITGFSPQGLIDSGYAPWIAMLRAALKSSGGLRIDHAFGLARLWVIPQGAGSAQGAYLSYPFLDLVRLVCLEAHHAQAMIIAEDLGTSPPGFTQAVSDRAMLGMRVLWFERAKDHGFIGAHDYPSGSVAMTGTHDTPTIAGWWTGRDLDWAKRLSRLPGHVSRAKAEEIRDWDRGLLWSTIGHGDDRPAPDNPAPAIDAALAHIARTPAVLAIAPLEDLLGEVEQPNLPGTITEHPNWQRRCGEPIEQLLCQPEVAKRLGILANRA